MTYIKTNLNEAGIVELLFYKGSTGKALSNLAHTLLRGPSKLTSAERELIAAYVSKLNDCEFCSESHSAVANFHLKDDGQTINCVISDLDNAPVSGKMKSLLKIAAKTQKSGREVSFEDTENARRNGASDEDIHDTVLIAAAFCMYNRYVDGLGTNLPEDKNEYLEMAERLGKVGYKYPPLFLRKFVIWLMNRKRSKK
ncbi:MAG: carboxymuconolactone decarboxylase family protein [Chitinophagales bacterium]|nr:carboxymuconolactone decarboxylase family protein [Chitinophagales bacterium]